MWLVSQERSSDKGTTLDLGTDQSVTLINADALALASCRPTCKIGSHTSLLFI